MNDDNCSFCESCGVPLQDLKTENHEKICPVCGNPLGEDDIFCDSCGSKVTGEAVSSVPVDGPESSPANGEANDIYSHSQPTQTPAQPGGKGKNKVVIPVIIAATVLVLSAAAIVFIKFRPGISKAPEYYEETPGYDEYILSDEEISSMESYPENDPEQPETSFNYLYSGGNTAPAEGVTFPAYTNPVPGQTTPAAPTQRATSPATTRRSQFPTPAPISGGLNSTNVSEVVSYYNSALQNTPPYMAPNGYDTYEMIPGSITGNGPIGAVTKIIEPILTNTLENHSAYVTDGLPGYGIGISPSDIRSAEAFTADGSTILQLNFREQTDGVYADPNYSGPVSRGMGTVGDFSDIFYETGIQFNSGMDTFDVTYYDAYLSVQIDNSTGKILSGMWHYRADVNIGNANVKVAVVNATLNDFSLTFTYNGEYYPNY